MPLQYVINLNGDSVCRDEDLVVIGTPDPVTIIWTGRSPGSVWRESDARVEDELALEGKTE
jgi:hypothetical protein